MKEVARTPNKVLFATWVYLFCEVLSFVCFSHFPSQSSRSSRSREKSPGGLYLDLVHPRVLSFVAQTFVSFLSICFPSFKALWHTFYVFSSLNSYLSLVQFFCQFPGFPGLPGNLLQKPFFFKASSHLLHLSSYLFVVSSCVSRYVRYLYLHLSRKVFRRSLPVDR